MGDGVLWAAGDGAGGSRGEDAAVDGGSSDESKGAGGQSVVWLWLWLGGGWLVGR